MKKTVLIVTAAVAAAAVVLIFGARSMFKTELKAMDSVKKLDDGFYSLEYKGDYGFDEYIEKGGGKSDEEMAEYIAGFLSHGFYKPEPAKEGFGCSAISVFSPQGKMIFGRNFDWEKCTAMVIVARPDNGYASVSTANLDFLGFGDGFLPEGMKNKLMSLAAVYVPLDGMNEKGLCVADLIIDDGTETHQNTEKPDITTTAAIRLLLDKCGDVPEAVEMLKKYDMNSSAGIQHHLAISDTDGNSVVVEYIDDKMYVTDAKQVTNFYLTQGERYGVGSEQSKRRYKKLEEAIAKTDGIMSAEKVKKTLESVAQHNYPDDGDTTEWSVVFDTGSLTAEYYRRENYDRSYRFKLKNDE